MFHSISLSAKEFQQKYGNTYCKIFRLNEEKLLKLLYHSQFKDKKFFILYKGDHIQAFFSFREVQENVFELGDVAKVEPNLKRLHFSEFLGEHSKNEGGVIIGFPNKYALKLELLAGYEIVSYYVKVPVLVLPFISFRFPFYVSNSVVKFNLGFLSLNFANGTHILGEN